MKKQRKYIPFFFLKDKKIIIKIKTSLKNIFINILNYKNNNNILYSSSMGLSGIFGPKKASILSTQLVIKNIILKLKEFKIKNIIIIIKGNSTQANRLNCIETFKNFKFNIIGIFDSLLHAHNGCRPKKYRRDKRNIILY